MTAAAAKRRQQEIPGTEPPRIAELEEVIGPYVEALYARRDLQVKEKFLRLQLEERMRVIDCSEYIYRDGAATYHVKLEKTEKIKVKREGDTDEVDD